MVTSLKGIYDTVELTVNFNVNVIEYQCVFGITPPTLNSSYTYYIKTPAVPLTINFPGLSNKECKFETTLKNADGTNFDVFVFPTFTPVVMQPEAIIL